ncbi:MAG: efflux RND transporter periplasmic adaptor subunit [Gammaproteobacteria bacterium]|nr:efflux RND transporter periplasmic adaptor subunit [Gammaproteobacteria bacterium]
MHQGAFPCPCGRVCLMISLLLNRQEWRRYLHKEVVLAGWLCASMMTGCQSEHPSATGAKPPPLAVKTMHPIEEIIARWDEFNGRMESLESVAIRSRVSGYLDRVLVKDGEKVVRGELLFAIDRRTYDIEVQRAQAELERVRTRRVLAQNDLRRATRLKLSKAISEEEFEQRVNGEADTTESLHAAEAQLAMAKLNLEFTQIRAPINGRIGRELITPGNLVKNDETLLTTIFSTDPVYVYLDIDERTALYYRRLQGTDRPMNSLHLDAELGLIDEEGYPHRGVIDYLEPKLESSTGTLKLRGVFQNHDELLSPGLFARVRIRSGSPAPALLIPSKAIGTDQNQRYVWKVNQDGSLTYQPVQLGEVHGSFRIIKEGLTSSDEVVIDGIAKIRPGVLVKPEPISIPYDG